MKLQKKVMMMTAIDNKYINDDERELPWDEDIIDAEFDAYPYEDSGLRELSDRVVDYWEEDYLFDGLLEEFDLDTKDAFYALLQTGMIDPEMLEGFLVD